MPSRLALAALLGVLVFGCGSGPSVPGPTASPPAGPPRLLVLSSMIGYVEPCGCTIDLLLGGIDRIAARVAAERADGPTAVLVVGPTFFESVPSPAFAAQHEAKARLLAESLAQLGVGAFVPASEDLARGRDFYSSLLKYGALPDVTVNVAGGAGRLLELGAARVGVFGLADPERGEVPAGAPLGDLTERARAEARRLRALGAQVVVGLGALPRPALRSVASEVPEVDLWVLGDHPQEEKAASPVGSAHLLEVGDRGRNLGRIVLHDTAQPGPLADPVGDRARARKALELRLKMQGDLFSRTGDAALGAAIEAERQKLATLEVAQAPTGKRFEYALVPIVKETPIDPVVGALVTAYNASLGKTLLANAPPAPPLPAGKSGYAGGKACIDCHAEAQTVWASTRHAKAWETLVKANKTFDAECVSCHVTGWMEPGGAALNALRGLENVQCEQCHGPGEAHIDVGGDEDSTERRVPATVCEKCHNHHHSPKFEYDSYLKKILGPGHAARE